jgi:hypothetical protein
MDMMPTPEMALEGVSFFREAAATCEDMAATRESATARVQDPQANLKGKSAIIACAILF